MAEECSRPETIKTGRGGLVERATSPIHGGNVRRTVMRQGGRSNAELPLTVASPAR
jgi:hypothetical protein